MNRVWQLSNQKGAALFLLIALAGYATCFPLTKTGSEGFAWPGLDALARKTRLSSRHLSRLVAGLPHPGRGLQAAGEILVLPRPGPGLPHPGRSHHYIVLTGTDAHRLSAALQRAAERGAAVDGLLDATLDRLPATREGLPATQDRQPATREGLSQPTHDVPHGGAMSSPTPDSVSSPPDNQAPVLGDLPCTPDGVPRVSEGVPEGAPKRTHHAIRITYHAPRNTNHQPNPGQSTVHNVQNS
jgi:hypothetical protein